MIHSKKGRRNLSLWKEATPESAKVTPIVCDEAMEKMASILGDTNLWVHEIITNRKKHSGPYYCEAKGCRHLHFCCLNT